jgi:hypothetical protein
MHRPLVRTSLSISFALLACACGAAGPGGASSRLPSEPTQFPTQDALAKIAAAPVPSKLFDDKAKDVPTWELSEPLPDAMDMVPHHDDTVWGKVLAEVAAARGDSVTTSEAINCVARQEAAFLLANEAIPAPPLVAFIRARCGLATGQVSVAYQTMTGDDRIPEAKIEEQFRASVKAMVEKWVTGRVDVGLAYLRKNGHAIFALTVSPRSVRIDRLPFTPAAGGVVVIRGESLEPTGTMRAMINRGRYGYGACTQDLTVALPKFAFACPALAADEAAWISILSVPPGRLLGTAVLDALVWPSGAPTKTYARLARDAAAAPVNGPVQLADMIQEVNRVRTSAGLPPVRAAEQESRTVARLAPHYFAGMLEGSSSDVADQVALGLYAGWEVEGLVRRGGMVSTSAQGAGDAAEIVRTALAHPFGRETLLDPEVERVAIGTVAGVDGADTGALFATYSLFDSYRHDNDGAIIAGRLTALRAARRALPPQMVKELNVEAQRAATSVQEGQKTPEEALDELLKRASERAAGRSVHAGISETSSLQEMKFPDSMLTAASLQYGAGSGHYRRQGHPWARFIVFYVMVDETVGPTALLGGSHAG